MEELLSLKWNNHRDSFLDLLSVLRKKNTYTDVTLACDGQLFYVHKMVLSACSDYFSTIFDSISCLNPVIVLKDISITNLESILDYMYLGEVSVKQTDLSSLIQAAECLKLKGLVLPECEKSGSLEKIKRPIEASLDTWKKSRNSITEETPMRNDDGSFGENPNDIKPSPAIPLELKNEGTSSDGIVSIKKESIASEEYAEAWDFNPSLNDGTNFGTNQDGNHYSTTTLGGFDDTENSINETASTFDYQQSASSSFHNPGNSDFIQCPKPREHYKKYTQSDKKKIIDCMREGKNWRHLAEALGIAYKTAYRWVRNADTDGDTVRPKGGNQKKLEDCQIDELCDIIGPYPQMTLNQVVKFIKKIFLQYVPASTVHSYLLDRGVTLKRKVTWVTSRTVVLKKGNMLLT